MPTINKTVDKTTVNGSETFVYTYNVSFSGLSEPTTSGKLIDFFPSKIKYQLPQTGGQLVSIDQTPTAGGVNVQFNFGNVTAGTSISFTVSCQFGLGREQGDSFTNVADLYADNVKVATASAPTVNLILDNSFALIKVPQISGPVKPGQEITFQLILQNLNDPGYRINNIVITDVLPSQLIPVTSFTPVGKDTSSNGFPDKTYDGRTGSFSGNTLNFTLPSYNGSDYTILFKATVASSVTPGQTITNRAQWTVDGVAKPDATTTFTVFEDKATATIIKRAPLYAAIGGEIQYNVLTTNTGTVPLQNFDVIDTPPTQVNITKISYNVDVSITPNYSLYIATSDNPAVYKTVATNIVGLSPVYDLTSLIPVGGRVTSIKASLSSVNPINNSGSMVLYGTVNQTATPDQVITNTATVTATSSLGNVTGSNSANTTLNGRSVLNISKALSPQLPAYYPLNEFYVSLTTRGSKGMIFNPTISDLLPTGLEYVPGNEYYFYYDNLQFKSYDSRNGNFPITLPTIEVIKNYQNTGRTLVRYRFPNFTLLLGNNIVINFSTLVKLNPPNSFTNYGYSGNPGSNTQVDGTSYTDVNDLDGDGITNESLAQSNAVSGAILTTSEFSLEKWVKGNLDNAFSKAASATAGGDVTYELNVTNNQDIDLKDIQIVDILPYVGDTGVILNTTPRGSQYQVYATAEVKAEIINILGDPVDPDPKITIEYSTSNDPVRFNQQGTGTIGTGTWSLIPPADITTLRSIRVTTDPSVILKPYERLIVTLYAKTPVGTPVNLLAYNSYAVRANKVVGGVVTPMNPAEPNKVSVQIKSATNSSIGNLVWNDLNHNGLYDVGEPGVNGITVELYDQSMNLLETTVTANNNLNQPGYYQFTDLAAGSYYVKFIPYGDYSLTIQQLVVNGSKPNQTTGLTNLISLGMNETNNTINAGVILPATAAIGNFVFEDLNHNGLYDVGEPGVNGITVELYDQNKNLLKTTVTANNNLNQPGYYQFTDLAAGSYYVKFIPTGDYELTIQQLVVNGSKPDPTTGFTNLITLTNGEVNNTIIAGVFIPATAAIGNFVFEDLNHNGLYDVGEPGVNGITVELYDQNKNLLKTTVTANNNLNQPGYYQFTDLAAGSYYVKFIPTGDYELTIQQLVVNGSKPDPTTGFTNLITLTNGEVNNTIIAGVFIPATAAIGNFVFEDLNHNGLYDVGEPGVNGITVELYDQNKNLLKTTVTANNNLNQPGYYQFTDLAAGSYYVKFIPTGDYELTIQQLVVNGSKPDPMTGFTNLITLTNGEVNNTIIAGVFIPATAAIGNFVFEDLNHNGLYDVGEPGVNGITVELYDQNKNLLKTTVTANNNLNQPGYYQFTDLAAGSYYVKFIPTGDYELTIQQLVVNGSKPDPTTGFTNLITLTNGEVNSTIIAGVFICTPPVINASNKCIHVDTPFDPLLGVTAFDCQGNNITDDIIVTANDVDTSVPGVYLVTYQVTDSRDQTTEKTIIVRVCKNSARGQSIIDIYESIALQQTALSHILNAEGEKLQKVLASNVDLTNLLLINNSIMQTVNSVTRLETVLYAKADLFKKAKVDCCD